MRWTGFALRIVFAIVLVLLIFNPSGNSYYHWIANEGWDTDLPLKVLSGIVLLIGVLICGRATYRSIKIIGVVLVSALIAAIVWVAYDAGMLDVKDPGVMQWVILLAIGFILGIGLSWSIIRRLITGQLDVDDADIDGN